MSRNNFIEFFNHAAQEITSLMRVENLKYLILSLFSFVILKNLNKQDVEPLRRIKVR